MELSTASTFKNNYPYKINDVKVEEQSKPLYRFSDDPIIKGLITIGSENWVFPDSFRRNAENCYNFKPRPDDIWIVTFPRSGTTWTQEIAWLLANNLDYKKAADISLLKRYTFIEYEMLFQAQFENLSKENNYSKAKQDKIREMATPPWEFLEKTTDRRFIKTHLPFQLLPPNLLEIGCKVIYVARNPKDVAVSYYHLHQLNDLLKKNVEFSLFWNHFQNNSVLWAPYWPHLQQGWEKRHNNNLLFLFYEDLNQNLRESVEKIANFLDVKYTNNQYNILLEHLKIDNFRKNKSVNYSTLIETGLVRNDTSGYVRTGKTGGWNDYFVGNLNVEADKWIQENLKKTDLRFPGFTV